jgi:hypothetical protein
MKMHMACVVILALAVASCSAGENGSQGGLALRVSDEATAGDAGLPTYPGSKPYKDEGDSSSGANLGLSTPLFGLKVVAMNLETRDEPERVAKFYRQALSKYGSVLECKDDGSDRASGIRDDAGGDELICEDDEPGTHSVVYKVGTEKNQRLVAIKPHGDGTRFSLVHLDVRGESKD